MTKKADDDRELIVPYEWEPRRHQRKLWAFLQRGGTRAIAVWHRRAGKDSIALNWSAWALHNRPATYWHMLPQAAQARKAIWEAVNPHTGFRLIDQAFPRELREATRENEMFIKFKCGSTWQVVGSDNYNSLVGSPPAGIVFSEFALADPGSWDFLRPILLENGGWALFISTPRGRNHLYSLMEMAKDDPIWFSEKLPASETNVFTALQLEQERKEILASHPGQDGENLFDQEYNVSFDAAILGAYYGKLLRAAKDAGRITRVPYDPKVLVETWWDLGIGDTTAIWFIQRVNAEVRLIDFYEMSGEGLPHYAKKLGELPYVYGQHVAPHDIEVRELGTGKSRKEIAAGLGINFNVAIKLSVEDGIDAARTLIPRCWFDAEKCKRGIEALEQYCKEWDDEKKIFRPRPLHNWCSHPADAFRYGAIANEPMMDWNKPLKYVDRWIV